MAKKSMLTEAQDTIVGAAKTGAALAKPVATAALGAAAAAAAGVVLESVSNALRSGAQKVDKAAPKATEVARVVASPSVERKARKKLAKKKRPAAKKKSAAKKKAPAAKKKGAAKKTAKKAGKKKQAGKKKRAAGRRGR